MHGPHAADPQGSASDNKKAEFPDAAALLAIQHWAEEHATHVLLVSRDGDWRRFCENHPRLLCVADLGAALSAFQDNSAQFIARRFADAEQETPPSAIIDAVFTEGALLRTIHFLPNIPAHANLDGQ